jgi:hypothetical protein
MYTFNLKVSTQILQINKLITPTIFPFNIFYLIYIGSDMD